MSFKRFVAATTKDAMAQVRRDLGDDAVILSNKRIANGHIEILAAGAQVVEAIVEDARRPQPQTVNGATQVAVQIAPGVRRIGPPVESFRDYLRRQGQAEAGPRTASPTVTASNGPASMYGAVAAAPADDDADDSAFNTGWSDSRFDPSMMPVTRAPAPLAAHTAMPAATGTRVPTATHAPHGAASAPVARAAAPEIDTWLPNDARIAAPVEPAPAVFRRRPSREASEVGGQAASVRQVAPQVASQAAPRPAQAPAQATTHAAQASMPAPTVSAAAPATAAAVAAPVPHTEIRLPQPDGAAQANAQLMAELASLRASLQQQLSSLSSTVAATDSMRRNPLQTRVMTRLLTAGFSVDVARKVALNAPELADAEAADTWMQDVIAHNMRCATADDSLIDRGGVYALVGPTGVGKTTTIAKLAARFAVKYGTASLGLITLDAYRVAAHEQLRTYGRILGTPVHLAQDAATLRELLTSMSGKRLVLIDTCGVGPRDERLGEMLATLAQAGHGAQRVQPVLLLNAASHAETLDDTARAWRAHEAIGTVLTKLDEAARIGGALDCALRHKLKLIALTNGQRVPEDLHLPNARLLAHLALKPANQLFELAEDEGTALAHLTQVARATAAHV